MSAAPLAPKRGHGSVPAQQAGSIALLLLRVTLMGCAAALVATLASIAWKAMG